MKKFGNPLYLLGVGLLFVTTTLISCNGEKKPVEKKQVHKDAHDWEPTDAELILGKEVYIAECALCHNHGEEQSPRLGKIMDWEERQKQSAETMIKKAIDGFIGDDGEMPARGGSPYLTDEQMSAAVKFMIATPKH